MSKLKKEIAHAVNHFFTAFLVVMAMKVYLPISDFVRRCWWKAWGHDPKADPHFHLSQITFDHHFGNRILITGSVHQLAKYIYGEANVRKSKAWLQMNAYVTFRYQPLEVYEKIQDLWNHDKPGRNLVNWFMVVDDINPLKLARHLSTSPGFEEFYDDLMTRELHKPTTEQSNHTKG